jgi:hypothetical protein
MGWMDMVKGAVVSGVIVVVHVFVSTMEMVVGMFMLVLMALEMFALVGMDFPPRAGVQGCAHGRVRGNGGACVHGCLSYQTLLCRLPHWVLW